MKPIALLLLTCVFFVHTIECKANDNDWMIGGWGTKNWGAIRLLDDGYAIDLNPEGKLQNWGVWQYYCSDNAVIIIWMESSMMEVIAKEDDKYYRQSAYPFGVSSEIVEVKKIFKEVNENNRN